MMAGMNVNQIFEETAYTKDDGSPQVGKTKQRIADGAAHVADVGLVSQRHNRFIDSITATWPGNDTFSMTFAQSENVRRYRVMVLGGVAQDYVKVVEDAVNEAQAEVWLASASSSASADVEYIRVFTSDAEANNFPGAWSDWQELSKDTSDLSLSRLDFLGSAAGAFTIFVEAE